MHHSNFIYHHGELELHGYVAHNDQDDRPKPGVLIIHDWSGQNEFVRQKAHIFAELGYVSFAIDMYGLGKNGTTTEEKQALIHPLINDRLLLRTRVQAAFDAAQPVAEIHHYHPPDLRAVHCDGRIAGAAHQPRNTALRPLDHRAFPASDRGHESG